jgi:hypothetical protein
VAQVGLSRPIGLRTGKPRRPFVALTAAAVADSRGSFWPLPHHAEQTAPCPSVHDLRRTQRSERVLAEIDARDLPMAATELLAVGRPSPAGLEPRTHIDDLDTPIFGGVGIDFVLQIALAVAGGYQISRRNLEHVDQIILHGLRTAL